MQTKQSMSEVEDLAVVDDLDKGEVNDLHLDGKVPDVPVNGKVPFSSVDLRVHVQT